MLNLADHELTAHRKQSTENDESCSCLKHSDVVFILLINVKMPKIYEQDKFHA